MCSTEDITLKIFTEDSTEELPEPLHVGEKKYEAKSVEFVQDIMLVHTDEIIELEL